jgi:hypothetical protein
VTVALAPSLFVVAGMGGLQEQLFSERASFGQEGRRSPKGSSSASAIRICPAGAGAPGPFIFGPLLIEEGGERS